MFRKCNNSFETYGRKLTCSEPLKGDGEIEELEFCNLKNLNLII